MINGIHKPVGDKASNAMWISASLENSIGRCPGFARRDMELGADKKCGKCSVNEDLIV